MHSYYKAQHTHSDMSYESKYLLDPKYMTKRDLKHYYRYYNFTKNNNSFKKIILVIFILCFFSYFFVDYSVRTRFLHFKERLDLIPHVYEVNNVSQAYFVDTPGCRMPYFDVTDDQIIQFMFKPESYSCPRPLIRTSDIGAMLIANMNETEIQDYYNVTDVAAIQCFYAEIKRVTDSKNHYGKLIPFKLEFNSSVRVNRSFEFIVVQCHENDDRPFYKDFHFFAIDKKTSTKVPIRSRPPSQVRPWSHEHMHMQLHEFAHLTTSGNQISDLPERVSVMLLGIDSVSHLNFLRQMRKSASFIQRKLSHVEFWGFNKVADNTYPNLMPVLSGLEASELNLACLTSVKHSNYDKCSFIWKRYKAAGYKTAYAEDVAALSLFNYFRPGFKKQPTDYYLRPILNEMELFISNKKSNNVNLCQGGRRTADVVFEYIRKLVPHLQTEDFFSFFWMVTLSHDLLNMPVLMDDEMVRTFELFESAGIFNKTVIFLMSDHGLRFGSFRKTYQGMMEERQPLLMVLYPNWMQEKYPLAIDNIKSNAHRLTTHFDLHATMLDILDLERLQSERLMARAADQVNEVDTIPRSFSLFLPIPETRTCEQAGIAAHWCTCHHRQELPTNDARVQRAARFVVKLINERLKRHPQCRMLYLNSILDAIYAAPYHKIVKEISNDYSIDMTVKIQTKPGLAVFESTVRMTNSSTILTGTISRLNLYGSQSFCINEYTLKMFCYCHR